MQRISVIIPTLNRPELLRATIASLMTQTRAADEVIVVDDGSRPPIEEATLQGEFGTFIKVMRNETSQGLAWARNQGVMAAAGDYVAHLDDDDLYAAETLAECAALLDADPALDLLFIGMQGFGSRAEHFNRVQPAGVEQVIRQGNGKEAAPDVVVFNQRLFSALIRRVPAPFQKVIARREVWTRVDALRCTAYQAAADLATPQAARELIRGTLRDSEWALYAAIACSKTALCNRPYYLARCDGQGGSSQPANQQRHMLQGLEIKTRLFQASRQLPELNRWQKEIGENLAQTQFDAAYACFEQGDRHTAWHHLRQAAVTQPHWKQAKLALKFLLSSPPGREE